MNNQQPTEVIVYRNPLEHWYWHHLGEVWGFIALLALAIYVVFFPLVFLHFKKKPSYDVPNWKHALLLTLFWPITLPITESKGY